SEPRKRTPTVLESPRSSPILPSGLVIQYRTSKMSSFFPPNNQRHKPGIGGFLIIIEHVVPAHRLNFLRQSHSQPPAREVDLMNSLIANISIAIGPPPVPVVVKTVLGERSDRSRSHPGTLGPTRTTCSTVVPPFRCPRIQVRLPLLSLYFQVVLTSNDFDHHTASRKN